MRKFCSSSQTILTHSICLIIAVQMRRTEQGVELIKKAIKLNEKVASAHNNLYQNSEILTHVARLCAGMAAS
jgi:hypothetical protein